MRPSVSRSLGSWRAWVALQPGAPAPGATGQDVGMVEEPIEQRRDGSGVAEELAPVFHGAIRGDQRRLSTGTQISPSAVIEKSPPAGSLRGLGGADEAGFELVLEPVGIAPDVQRDGVVEDQIGRAHV